MSLIFSHLEYSAPSSGEVSCNQIWRRNRLDLAWCSLSASDERNDILILDRKRKVERSVLCAERNACLIERNGRGVYWKVSLADRK